MQHPLLRIRGIRGDALYKLMIDIDITHLGLKRAVLRRSRGQAHKVGQTLSAVFLDLTWFGIQQQIRNSMTITWPNINIVKIQHGW